MDRKVIADGVFHGTVLRWAPRLICFSGRGSSSRRSTKRLRHLLTVCGVTQRYFLDGDKEDE